MSAKPFGCTSEQVSALCLGSEFFRTRIEKKQFFSLLDYYYQAGGRFIDTANSYVGWMPGGKGETAMNLSNKFVELLKGA